MIYVKKCSAKSIFFYAPLIRKWTCFSTCSLFTNSLGYKKSSVPLPLLQDNKKNKALKKNTGPTCKVQILLSRKRALISYEGNSSLLWKQNKSAKEGREKMSLLPLRLKAGEKSQHETLLTESVKPMKPIKKYKGQFFNQCFDKGRLKNFVLWFLLNYGEHKTVSLVEQLKNVGFEYASRAGISLGIDDLKIPPKKSNLIYDAENLTNITVNQYIRGEITGVERFQRLIDTWHRTSEVLKQEVIDYFEATDILNPVYMMAFSGARGNISQVRQLVGMRGLMADPQGQIIDFPIRSNFREGLTLTEYIISSYGARKGIVDTALRTANAGYLTRRLVDVAQHIIISNFDCGTNRGIFLTNMKEGNKTIHSLSQRIVGRILARDLFIGLSTVHSSIKNKNKEGKQGKEDQISLKLTHEGKEEPKFVTNSLLTQKVKGQGGFIASRNEEVTLDLAFEIGKKFEKVFVRSPLTCEKLICQLCYGWSLAQGSMVSIGEAVGVVAAQSIGEPGTQLTMRTFHTGGVFSGDVSDQIKAPFDGIIQYISAIPGTLIRTPEGKISFLTKSEGSFLVKKIASLPLTVTQSETESTNSNYNKELVSVKSLFPSYKKEESTTSKLVEIKKFTIPHYTLLYIRNGQNVYEKEVIAQISSISQKTNATDDAELTIKSEIEGQFYSKFLGFREKIIGCSLRSASSSMPTSQFPTSRKKKGEKEQFRNLEWLANPLENSGLPERLSLLQNVGKQEKIYEAWTWGYAWILSGKIYDYKNSCSFQTATPSLPIIGDLLNTKSYMTQNKWSINNRNGSSISFYYNKRTPSMLSINEQNAKQNKINTVPLVLSNSSLSLRRKTLSSFKPGRNLIALKSNIQRPDHSENSLFEDRKGKGFGSLLQTKNRSSKQLVKTIPSQTTQILFIDLNNILFKKYGYALEVSEKNQFRSKNLASASYSYHSLQKYTEGKEGNSLQLHSNFLDLGKQSNKQLLYNNSDFLFFGTGITPFYKKEFLAKSALNNKMPLPLSYKNKDESALSLLSQRNKVARFIAKGKGLGFSAYSPEGEKAQKKNSGVAKNKQTEKLPYIVQWFPKKYKTESGGFIIFENGIFSKKSPFFETSSFLTTTMTNKRNIERTYTLNRNLLLKTREINNSKILLIPSDVFKISTVGIIPHFLSADFKDILTLLSPLKNEEKEGDKLCNSDRVQTTMVLSESEIQEKIGLPQESNINKSIRNKVYYKKSIVSNNSNSFMSIFLNKKINFLQKNRQGCLNISSFDFLLPISYTGSDKLINQNQVDGNSFKSSILLKIKKSIINELATIPSFTQNDNPICNNSNSNFSLLPPLYFRRGGEKESFRKAGNWEKQQGLLKSDSRPYCFNFVSTKKCYSKAIKLVFFKNIKIKKFTTFCQTVSSFVDLGKNSKLNQCSLLFPTLEEKQNKRVLLYLNSIDISSSLPTLHSKRGEKERGEIQKTITVSNYLEKYLKKFNTVKNKFKFYSFVLMQPCIYFQNPFILDSLFKRTAYLKKDSMTNIVSREGKEASQISSIDPYKGLKEKKDYLVRKAYYGKEKKEIVFHGTAKKGWVFVTNTPFLNIESKFNNKNLNKFSKYSNSLLKGFVPQTKLNDDAWPSKEYFPFIKEKKKAKKSSFLTIHKKLIYAGQPVFNKIAFNTSVFAESFLLSNIFNIKNISSFSKIVFLQEIAHSSSLNSYNPINPIKDSESRKNGEIKRDFFSVENENKNNNYNNFNYNNNHKHSYNESQPNKHFSYNSNSNNFLLTSTNKEKEDVLTLHIGNGEAKLQKPSLQVKKISNLKWITNKKYRYLMNNFDKSSSAFFDLKQNDIPIKSEQKIGFISYLFQPIKEFQQMNNLEIKKYTYESTINAFNNSYKKNMSGFFQKTSPNTVRGTFYKKLGPLFKKPAIPKTPKRQSNSSLFYVEKESRGGFFKELLLVRSKLINKISNTSKRLKTSNLQKVRNFLFLTSFSNFQPLFLKGFDAQVQALLKGRSNLQKKMKKKKERVLLFLNKCTSLNLSINSQEGTALPPSIKLVSHRLSILNERKVLVNQSFDSVLKLQQFRTQNLVAASSSPLFTYRGHQDPGLLIFKRDSYFRKLKGPIREEYSAKNDVLTLSFLYLKSDELEQLLILHETLFFMQSNPVAQKATKIIDKKMDSNLINSLLLFILCSIQKINIITLQTKLNKSNQSDKEITQKLKSYNDPLPHSLLPGVQSGEDNKKEGTIFKNFSVPFYYIKDLKALLRASSVKQLINDFLSSAGGSNIKLPDQGLSLAEKARDVATISQLYLRNSLQLSREKQSELLKIGSTQQIKGKRVRASNPNQKDQKESFLKRAVLLEQNYLQGEFIITSNNLTETVLKKYSNQNLNIYSNQYSCFWGSKATHNWSQKAQKRNCIPSTLQEGEKGEGSFIKRPLTKDLFQIGSQSSLRSQRVPSSFRVGGGSMAAPGHRGGEGVYKVLGLIKRSGKGVALAASTQPICLVSRKPLNVSPFLINYKNLPSLPSFSKVSFANETTFNSLGKGVLSTSLTQSDGSNYFFPASFSSSEGALLNKKPPFSSQRPLSLRNDEVCQTPSKKGETILLPALLPSFVANKKENYNLSYLPISNFDCYLYPLLSIYLSSILNFYSTNIIKNKREKRITQKTNILNTYKVALWCGTNNAPPMTSNSMAFTKQSIVPSRFANKDSSFATPPLSQSKSQSESQSKSQSKSQSERNKARKQGSGYRTYTQTSNLSPSILRSSSFINIKKDHRKEKVEKYADSSMNNFSHLLSENKKLNKQKTNKIFSYAIFNSLINNVFESPCFSFNLVKLIDLSAFKKTKTQKTQFLYNNDLNQNFSSVLFNTDKNNVLFNKQQEKSGNSLFKNKTNQIQQIQAKTNYYSPFKGEIVYAQTIAPKDKLLLNDRVTAGSSTLALENNEIPQSFLEKAQWSPSLCCASSDSLKEKSEEIGTHEPKFSSSKISQMQSEKSKKLLAQSAKGDTFNYSCMFLTKKDLISYYFPYSQQKQESTKLKKLLSLEQSSIQKERSIHLTYQKNQNYEINDTLIKFSLLTPLYSEDDKNEFISKLSISGPLDKNKNIAPSSLIDGGIQTVLQISKTQAGKPMITGSPFRITNNKSLSLLGDFYAYGDPINQLTPSSLQKKDTAQLLNSLEGKENKHIIPLPEKLVDERERKGVQQRAIQVSGQIIHYNKTKITVRRAQPIFISPKGILHKFDGDFIDPKSPVITLSYQRLKTGDIIQGIPKVEQFFEARTTKRGRLFRDSLPSLLKALFKRYESKIPLELAVRQSFYKIQQILVDGVQRVYKSQGVTISDKHLEVIVKQMTSKVRVIDGAQTGFFPGEVVDLTFIEKINQFLIKKITYEPLVLGITKASLEVDSFLSASSFQQTTRVLSQAAIYRKKDFLKGLKENVILGNLIPAGTGYLVQLDNF